MFKLGFDKSIPLTVKFPLSIVSRRLKQRSRVLLPHPEEPITATTSCLLISPLIPLRTFRVPKFFSMLLKVIVGVFIYGVLNFILMNRRGAEDTEKRREYGLCVGVWFLGCVVCWCWVVVV